jgi:AAHS family 4-hydroxybenzoate transporter-like MFS transporter
VNTTEKVNVSKVLDDSRIGPFQIFTFALCGACLIMDGFDIQALSFASPSILAEWGAASSSMGGVFAAGNFGVLLGSVFFTMAADKLGRRPVLIAGTFFYSIFTILTALATSIDSLLVLRLVAGIGIGSIVPNSTALVGEYSPLRLRIALMMGISSGFTAGGMVAGFAAGWLIPAYGWRSLFYVGGALPLLIAVLMIAWLPESLQFLAVRRKNLSQLGKWLCRVDPGLQVSSATEYVAAEENRQGIPVFHLFGQRRAVGTVLLWAANFLNLLNLYFLTQWMATVLRDAGYPPATAVFVSNILQIGGWLGAFGNAWLISKWRPIPVLSTCFFSACLAIALLGQLIPRPALPIGLLAAIMFIAGWCVVGCQPGLNAVAGTYYPTYLRSTGIGWALGIGRFGAILGPYLGGTLMGLKWPVGRLFLAAAIPAVAAAAVMLSLRGTMKSQLDSGTRT